MSITFLIFIDTINHVKRNSIINNLNLDISEVNSFKI